MEDDTSVNNSNSFVDSEIFYSDEQSTLDISSFISEINEIDIEEACKYIDLFIKNFKNNEKDLSRFIELDGLNIFHDWIKFAMMENTHNLIIQILEVILILPLNSEIITRSNLDHTLSKMIHHKNHQVRSLSAKIAYQWKILGVSVVGKTFNQLETSSTISDPDNTQSKELNSKSDSNSISEPPNKKKKTKNVRWAPEDKLLNIRFFSTQPPTQPYVSTFTSSPSISLTMAPSIPWNKPTPLHSSLFIERGSKSQECLVQTLRNQNILESIYLKNHLIPPSPTMPDTPTVIEGPETIQIPLNVALSSTSSQSLPLFLSSLSSSISSSSQSSLQSSSSQNLPVPSISPHSSLQSLASILENPRVINSIQNITRRAPSFSNTNPPTNTIPHFFNSNQERSVPQYLDNYDDYVDYYKPPYIPLHSNTLNIPPNPNPNYVDKPLSFNRKKPTNRNLKTQLCKFYNSPAGCHYGDQCFFIHPIDKPNINQNQSLPFS